MNAFHMDVFAHGKLKGFLSNSLPHVKSSHRAEAIARGFGFGSNAALLVALSGSATLGMQPARFVEYLASKGWAVPGSVFVAACFALRGKGFLPARVPHWGAAFVEGEWMGLVLWENKIARAGIAVPKGADGPAWLARVDLTGVPLSLFRGEGDPMWARFDADLRVALGYRMGAVAPRGEFTYLGQYLGGERFPHGDDHIPEYEVYGASSLPITSEEGEARRREARAAGFYASLVDM